MTDERIMQVGKARLNVRRTGDGHPLLLINGLGAHSAMWAPVERRLPDLHLISYDSPGIGASPPVIPPRTLGGLADLAADLLDTLGYDRIDVLGYSLGGAIAQEFARRHPERVRRLVLCATLPGWGCVLGEWRSLALAYNPLRYFSRPFYDRTIGTLAGGQARHDADFRRRHAVERLTRRPDPLSYYAQIAAISSWSSLPWLGELRAPTLVVTGDDDPLVSPANSHLLASRIPEARLVVAPGEGHLMLFDDNGAAHESIGDFVRAPSLEECAAWRNAVVVGPGGAAAAIRARGLTMPPWGVLSSVYRAQALRVRTTP